MTFILIDLCVDRGLENVADKSEMITNGWVICIDNGDSKINNLRYENTCNSQSVTGFWGYSYGCPVGGVSAQFEGSGIATLSFGSCYWKGSTKVYLNEKNIKTADSSQSSIAVSEEVTFEYNRGDVLKLEEWGPGIVKINSLKLTECKGIVDLCLLVLTKIVMSNYNV